MIWKTIRMTSQVIYSIFVYVAVLVVFSREGVSGIVYWTVFVVGFIHLMGLELMRMTILTIKEIFFNKKGEDG